jgi:hypothetical protein
MRRRTGRSQRHRVVVNALLVVLLVLLPLGYVFQRLWVSIEDGARFHAAESEGVAWVRPLTKLLATLVDAQVTATAGAIVDVQAVRAAVGEVSRVEADHGDPLNIRHRWDPMPDQIDALLAQQISGPRALTAYAVPIEMTQSLLGTAGDASTLVRDPGIDAHYLIKTTVVDVPDIIVNVGRLAGTANDLAARPGVQTALAADPRAAVALDRITRAAAAIRGGPRSAADETTGEAASIGLLKPLDALVAATDGLARAVTALSHNPAAAQTDFDTAQVQVRSSSFALETAALDALDALLQKRINDIAVERQNEVLAGLAIALAAVLLWLVNRSAGGSAPGTAGIESHPSDHPHRRRRRLRRPAGDSAPEPAGIDDGEFDPAVPQPTGSR